MLLLYCAVPLKFMVITKNLSTFKGFILEKVFLLQKVWPVKSSQVCKFTATPLGVLQVGYRLDHVLVVNVLWIMLTPCRCWPLSTELYGLWSQCINWTRNFTSLWSTSLSLV